MARLPRLSLVGFPHHIIQRGNNSQPIFKTSADYVRMLALLQEQSKKFQVSVHAYVLMENHFHLLATPQSEGGLSAMMQAVGRAYVRYFNDTHHRTGTLWDGRYRSTVIEAERYLLPCMVFIDSNPLRAGLVTQVGPYPWSSFGHYCGQQVDKLITVHPLVWALGNTPFAREAAYTEMVHAGISSVQKLALTDATLSGWALGSPEFLQRLQKDTPRRLTKRSAGRPAIKQIF